MSGRRLEKAGSPRGLLRLVLRLPVPMYRAGLGFLLGHRFLMIEHRGRKTGETRRTVLEVVTNHPDGLYVVAAWGRKAQWLQNLQADPRVRVFFGSRRFDTTARMVDDYDVATGVLNEYAAKHPTAFQELSRLTLSEPGSDQAESVTLMASLLPMVELPRARQVGR